MKKNIRSLSLLFMIFLFLIPFHLFSIDLRSQKKLPEEVVEQLRSAISDYYYIPDVNGLYHVENTLIFDSFFKILSDYSQFSQEELDRYGKEQFALFYDYVNLGSLEDSIDHRRQSMRAAMLYSSIALCSKDNSSYYINLAYQSLQNGNGDPVELIEDCYIGQILVHIYICYLKNDEMGCRYLIDYYFDNYTDLINEKQTAEDMKKLFTLLRRFFPEIDK